MTEHLNQQTYDLLFAIRRSVRYHLHRRRFYEVWNTTTIAVASVGGSGAVAIALGNFWPNGLPIVAAFIAIVAILDLAVGTTIRNAGHHGELTRCYIELEKEFAHGKNLTDEELEDITRERLIIEASEPPVMRLLDMMCHYEILISYGDNKKSHPSVPLGRRFLMHFLSQASYARSLPA